MSLGFSYAWLNDSNRIQLKSENEAEGDFWEVKRQKLDCIEIIGVVNYGYRSHNAMMRLNMITLTTVLGYQHGSVNREWQNWWLAGKNRKRQNKEMLFNGEISTENQIKRR